jgi:hypothetical protein
MTTNRITPNRVTPYEAGWLRFLVDAGLATRQESADAARRVAVAAIKELERMHRLKKSRRNRLRRRRPADG